MTLSKFISFTKIQWLAAKKIRPKRAGVLHIYFDASQKFLEGGYMLIGLLFYVGVLLGAHVSNLDVWDKRALRKDTRFIVLT